MAEALQNNPNNSRARLLAAIGVCSGCLAGIVLGASTGNVWAALVAASAAFLMCAIAIAVHFYGRSNELARALRAAHAAIGGAEGQQETLQRAAKAEHELSDLLQKIKLAMNSAGISMWEFDVKTDACRVMAGSPFTTQRLSGRTEYFGYEYRDSVLHPEDRDSWVPVFTAGMSKPPGDDLFSHRYRAIFPDGTLHWIQFHCRVVRTPSGRPRGCIGVDWDVTAEVNAAEAIAAQSRAIKEVEKRLQRAVGGTRDALFDLHADGAKSWIAPRFYSLLGYDEGEFQMSSDWWNSLVHPDDKLRRQQALLAHATRSEPVNMEYRLRHKLGHWVWVRARGVSSVERDANGRPEYFSGALQDIMEERAARETLISATQAAEDASRAKSAFLATMSHEIRTPMNGIIGMATLLLDSALDKTQRDYAETVLASADSLLKILNDILDFSKIEAGKMEIELVEMDLTATVEDIASLMSFQCAAKNLELIVNIHPDAPEWVVGDPQRIRQCLLNLVGNAIKFTQQGEVLIDVLPVAQHDGKSLVQFEIRDTGVGIDPDVLKSLFQPFTQADSSTTRRFGGTGLGLSIVRRLVELMGGQVGSQSEPGKGSLFWFMLPLQAADAKFDKPPMQVLPATHRVLLVDDNETNRRVLAGHLRQAGYEVDTASSGRQALTIMRERVHLPFDVVLLDFEMPEMDGATLGEQIVADMALSRTRLVMLTSLDRGGDMQRFSDIGFAAYLAKPIRSRELLRCLRKVLGYEANVWQSRSQPMVTRGNLLSSDGAQYSGKVLLVEDNLINQRVACRFLERLGCEVEIADDGVKAVAAFETKSYGLILMDMQMPIMDGLEATRRIRSTEARKLLSRTPIVALTANAHAGQMELCLESGMDDYLTKPLDIDRLHGTLDRYLGGRNSAETQSHAAVKPAIDSSIAARLMEVAGDDIEFARELVETFETSSRDVLVEMHAACSAHNLQSLGRAAHKLKGASGNLHLKLLETLARELENRSKACESRDWSRDLDTIKNEFERVQAELNEAVDAQGTLRRSA